MVETSTITIMTTTRTKKREPHPRSGGEYGFVHGHHKCPFLDHDLREKWKEEWLAACQETYDAARVAGDTRAKKILTRFQMLMNGNFYKPL